MSETCDIQYKRLFQASPGKILVLQPGSYEIVSVTDAYLKATLTRESDIVGKSLFDVFPDDPQDREADGVRNQLRSLERVQSLKSPDIMGVQRYPIRLPDGTFEERFWSVVNSPVLNDAGDVEFIMHRVEDVTAIVRESSGSSVPEAGGSSDPTVIQDIILRSQELRQALSKLQEYETRMRTAERLLHLGAWEYKPNNGQLSWSEQVFSIYGVPAGQSPPDLDGYFALVHPDDRESSRAIYDAFAEQNASELEFEHRVISDDGEVRICQRGGRTPSDT